VWSPVTAITLRPPSWFGGTFTHQGEGAVIVIDGAKDSRAKTAGAGLFPEIMRAEFHGIRATIEAYSRGARIAGEDDASACGLMLQKGSNDVVHVRVTDGNGVRLEYRIDRWD
jgi:hypothetical protein